MSRRGGGYAAPRRSQSLAAGFVTPSVSDFLRRDLVARGDGFARLLRRGSVENLTGGCCSDALERACILLRPAHCRTMGPHHVLCDPLCEARPGCEHIMSQSRREFPREFPLRSHGKTSAQVETRTVAIAEPWTTDTARMVDTSTKLVRATSGSCSSRPPSRGAENELA